MTPLIVTGTDTGIGKTVVAAMLTLALDGVYWKPIQCGTENGTDTQRVRALTGLGADSFRNERYCLAASLSPHRAAEIDGVTIDAETLHLPGDMPPGRPLIVEGAGGVLVPVTRDMLQIDLFTRWNAPVILCARTQLGTINHSLLTLEALRQRRIPVLGIVFIGEEMRDSEDIIVAIGRAKHLGRLPHLPSLNAAALLQAFRTHFKPRDFSHADG